MAATYFVSRVELFLSSTSVLKITDKNWRMVPYFVMVLDMVRVMAWIQHFHTFSCILNIYLCIVYNMIKFAA